MKHFWGTSTLVVIALLATLVGITGCKRLDDPEANLLQLVKQQGVLTIGVKYDSPPFGYMDKDGQLKGFEIELAKKITQSIMGSPDKVKFQQVQTATRIPTLNARHVDMVIATLTITDERRKQVWFTQPYFKARQAVMVKLDSPITRLPDLGGKEVVFVIGGRGEGIIKDTVPTALRLGFRSSVEAFTAFQAGRGDAFTTDDSILMGFMAQSCGVRLLKERLSEEPYGIALRLDSGSKPLAFAVQTALSKLAASGELAELKRQWLTPPAPKACPNN